MKTLMMINTTCTLYET